MVKLCSRETITLTRFVSRSPSASTVWCVRTYFVASLASFSVILLTDLRLFILGCSRVPAELQQQNNIYTPCKSRASTYDMVRQCNHNLKFAVHSTYAFREIVCKLDEQVDLQPSSELSLTKRLNADAPLAVATQLALPMIVKRGWSGFPVRCAI